MLEIVRELKISVLLLENLIHNSTMLIIFLHTMEVIVRGSDVRKPSDIKC